jgi:hypothetical protein
MEGADNQHHREQQHQSGEIDKAERVTWRHNSERQHSDGADDCRA